MIRLRDVRDRSRLATTFFSFVAKAQKNCCCNILILAMHDSSNVDFDLMADFNTTTMLLVDLRQARMPGVLSSYFVERKLRSPVLRAVFCSYVSEVRRTPST